MLASVSMSSFTFSMRQQWFTHVRLLVAHLTRCCGPSPQSLPTPALDRHDTAVVWDLRLHGEPGGPTSIPGTARFVLAIFYIVTTPLSGRTTPGCAAPGEATSASMGRHCQTTSDDGHTSMLGHWPSALVEVGCRSVVGLCRCL